MRAAMLDHEGFRLIECPQPACGPGQLLVRTLACGVCEGDVHAYRTRAALDNTPLLLGHEGTGEVVAVGADLDEEVWMGARVTALGGAYADYFVTTPDAVVQLPQDADPTLALGEPVACCVHAGWRFGVQPGDRVAVVGCGFMGLVCLQLARRQGATYLAAFEPIAERRDAACRLGADEAHPPELGAATSFDVVIEAAGVPGALDLAGDLVKEHGRLIIVGYHQSNGGQRTVNMQQWNYKAIDVVNGHVRRQNEKLVAMRAGINLLLGGDLCLEPLIIPYPLADVEQAFVDIVNRKPGIFKAVLIPDTK
jgi:threonine dehydrogenase-like Zn-dependent dehydrogenase